MNRTIFSVGLAGLLGAGAAMAQTPPRRPHHAPMVMARRAAGHFSIRGHLYPPELVMRNQQAIGLTEEQKEAIRGAIRDAERRFLDLKWSVQDASETLRGIVDQDRVEEREALEQLEAVLKAEHEIKRTQFQLMIRIKNLLDPEQQRMLDELRGPGAEAPEAPEPSSEF
ncbi:MAG: hypothetical protein HY509_01300 [Acidobacteria bacterium]|nr:hypothetical protein [Acidobacteriota bacterium]